MSRCHAPRRQRWNNVMRSFSFAPSLPSLFPIVMHCACRCLQVRIFSSDTNPMETTQAGTTRSALVRFCCGYLVRPVCTSFCVKKERISAASPISSSKGQAVFFFFFLSFLFAFSLHCIRTCHPGPQSSLRAQPSQREIPTVETKCHAFYWFVLCLYVGLAVEGAP